MVIILVLASLKLQWFAVDSIRHEDTKENLRWSRDKVPSTQKMLDHARIAATRSSSLEFGGNGPVKFSA
jgi:hypothetical protein